MLSTLYDWGTFCKIIKLIIPIKTDLKRNYINYIIMENTENKYKQGKIYTIRSPNTDKIYIGSTVQQLHKRFGDHKYEYMNQDVKYRMTSSKIIACGNSYIELLENYPCNSKSELEKREGELIRENKLIAVNRHIPLRTDKEYREDNADKIKLWHDTHKDWKKKYREDHKDDAIRYYEENREKFLKDKKANYQKNKEAVKAKNSIKILCECGKEYYPNNRTHHFRTSHHINFMA